MSNTNSIESTTNSVVFVQLSLVDLNLKQEDVYAVFLPDELPVPNENVKMVIAGSAISKDVRVEGTVLSVEKVEDEMNRYIGPMLVSSTIRSPRAFPVYLTADLYRVVVLEAKGKNEMPVQES